MRTGEPRAGELGSEDPERERAGSAPAIAVEQEHRALTCRRDTGMEASQQDTSFMALVWVAHKGQARKGCFVPSLKPLQTLFPRAVAELCSGFSSTVTGG